MPKTHTLSTDQYLYAVGTIYGINPNKYDPPTKLAIGKTINMDTGNQSVIEPDDKLLVQGTEITDSQRRTIAKSFYFITAKALMWTTKWETGIGFYFIGVNSEGDSILSVPQMNGSPTIVTTFKLPLKFDWSSYGVKVPGSALAEAQSELDELKDRFSRLQQERRSEVDELNEQLLTVQEEKLSEAEKLNQLISQLKQDLKAKEREEEEKTTQVQKLEKQVHEQSHELAELRRMKEDYTTIKELKQKLITSLEHQVQEKDEQIGKSNGKVEELKKQLNSLQLKLGKEEIENAELRQQVTCLGQQITSLRTQVKGKDKWIQDLVREVLSSRLASPVAPSIAQQSQSEKLFNQKIDQMISVLNNIESMVIRR